MANDIFKSYDGIDPSIVAKIATIRQQEADEKNPLKIYKKEAEHERNLDKYLEESSDLYFEEARETAENITTLLAMEKMGLGEQELAIASTYALNNIKMASEIQKIKESRARERAEKFTVAGGLIAAAVTLAADAGIKGKFGPFTEFAKKSGRNIWNVFKGKH